MSILNPKFWGFKPSELLNHLEYLHNSNLGMLKKKKKKKKKKKYNWTLKEWQNILWTDESKFELLGSKR